MAETSLPWSALLPGMGREDSVVLQFISRCCTHDRLNSGTLVSQVRSCSPWMARGLRRSRAISAQVMCTTLTLGLWFLLVQYPLLQLDLLLDSLARLGVVSVVQLDDV